MNAYIVAGYRTPIGKASRGGFRFTRPEDLGATAIKKVLEAVPGFDPARINDLIVGNAMPEGEQGLNMARYIALMSLPQDVPATTVNRYCASGLESIVMASAKIHAGQADAIIAGGSESMSLVPMSGYRTVPHYELAKSHPDYYYGMGNTAEEVAVRFNITRDDADAFALQSHMRAIKAQEAGAFTDEIVPVTVKEVYVENEKRKEREFTVAADEGPRRDTTPEALGKLKPVFKSGGVVTAGNSSQTSDGAGFVLVVSEQVLKEHNLTPIARVVGYGMVGIEPIIMGVGPIKAIPQALKRAGLKQDDIDTIELNEAFATQALAIVRELGLNPDRVNPNGGAIALGHPLGATGACLSIKLFSELKRRKAKYGIVSACVGGGQGIAGIYEMLN